ncbi:MULTISPECIES: DUF2637 domain-containing protein [unclassified Streptomyces]|uniref:DUF2637 domain-containing protein n=1 Tax=unclassified Streptomyces TaxID=2593676 RepID=UPI003864BCC2
MDFVNHDYPDHWFAPQSRYPGTYTDEQSTDWHRGASDTLRSMSPPQENWDPVEELTHLLQDVATAEQGAAARPPRSKPSSGADADDAMDNLVQLTAELPPIRRFSAGHRKVRSRKLRFTWLQTVSFVIAALAAAIVSMVSVFGGMVAYSPLQHVAPGARGATTYAWPLLIYGPWMVASLSILRTALHQRRAVHSWFVVLLFSSLAMILCMAEAERTFTSVAAAALPAVASLACFQQLVRQITLTRPPRQRASRRRQHHARRPPESQKAKSS